MDILSPLEYVWELGLSSLVAFNKEVELLGSAVAICGTVIGLEKTCVTLEHTPSPVLVLYFFEVIGISVSKTKQQLTLMDGTFVLRNRNICF